MCSIVVSDESLKLVEIDCYIKSLIFSSHQNLDSPKIRKYAITLQLSRHAKSSLTATRGFIFSTTVSIKLSISRNVTGNNYLFPSLRLTSDSPRSQEVFLNIWSLLDLLTSISLFPHNYFLDVFLGSLNLMLRTWVRIFEWKIVEFVPPCGIFMDQNCQKVLLVLINLSIQTYISSTLPMSFFSIKLSILIAFYLKVTVRLYSS